MSMTELEYRPDRRDLPYDQRSAVYDQYAKGDTIAGWAFKLIDDHLNRVKELPDYAHLPRVRCTQVVERRAECKVGDSPLIHASSVHPTGSRYVVFILDKWARWDIEGRDYDRREDDRWGVVYQAKSGTFGGMGTEPTLEQAIARYDALRGATPEQTTLF